MGTMILLLLTLCMYCIVCRVYVYVFRWIGYVWRETKEMVVVRVDWIGFSSSVGMVVRPDNSEVSLHSIDHAQ